jgi:hypothetical protein
VRRFTDEAILDLLLLEEKKEEKKPAMGIPGWNSINPHLCWKLAWKQRKVCEQVSICTASACRERG